jgi:hypothetical protein
MEYVLTVTAKKIRTINTACSFSRSLSALSIVDFIYGRSMRRKREQKK